MSESTTSFRIGDEPDLSPDEVFAEPTADERNSTGLSPLDGLRLALAEDEKVDLLPVIVRVPSRPGVTLLLDPNTFDDDKRKAWIKRSTKKKRGTDEIDELMFAGLVIANTCQEVRWDGKAAADDEGTPLTFRHKMLWDMVRASEPLGAIRKLFSNDAHVLVASNDVLMEAGYDDDLSVDPTGA